MTQVMVSLMPMGPGQEEKHVPLAVPVVMPAERESFAANRKAAFEAASWVFEYTNIGTAEWPHRSLSVGDVVQVKMQCGRVLTVGCCSVGWCLLTRQSRNVGRDLGMFEAWAAGLQRGAYMDAVQVVDKEMAAKIVAQEAAVQQLN